MIEADSIPTLSALRAEYGDRMMNVSYLCHQLKDLAESFRDCLVAPDDGDHAEKDLSDRLLRHYISEGLVSPPDKEKGENRFGLQHVMELLAVRKLQSEKTLTLAGMRDLVKGSAPEHLYDILTRGTQLRIEPKEAPDSEFQANDEALRAIRRIQQETGRSRRSRNHPAEPADPASSPWRAHHPLAPGLEVVFSDSYQTPSSLHEEHLLVDQFRTCLREHRRHRSDR